MVPAACVIPEMLARFIIVQDNDSNFIYFQSPLLKIEIANENPTDSSNLVATVLTMEFNV